MVRRTQGYAAAERLMQVTAFLFAGRLIRYLRCQVFALLDYETLIKMFLTEYRQNCLKTQLIQVGRPLLNIALLY